MFLAGPHEHNALFCCFDPKFGRGVDAVPTRWCGRVRDATVHGQGHRDNKRVMMNDVLPSKKQARAHAHVGSLYEPLTRFNDSENYGATNISIQQIKSNQRH